MHMKDTETEKIHIFYKLKQVYREFLSETETLDKLGLSSTYKKLELGVLWECSSDDIFVFVNPKVNKFIPIGAFDKDKF